MRQSMWYCKVCGLSAMVRSWFLVVGHSMLFKTLGRGESLTTCLTLEAMSLSVRLRQLETHLRHHVRLHVVLLPEATTAPGTHVGPAGRVGLEVSLVTELPGEPHPADLALVGPLAGVGIQVQLQLVTALEPLVADGAHGSLDHPAGQLPTVLISGGDVDHRGTEWSGHGIPGRERRDPLYANDRWHSGVRGRW